MKSLKFIGFFILLLNGSPLMAEHPAVPLEIKSGYASGEIRQRAVRMGKEIKKGFFVFKKAIKRAGKQEPHQRLGLRLLLIFLSIGFIFLFLFSALFIFGLAIFGFYIEELVLWASLLVLSVVCFIAIVKKLNRMKKIRHGEEVEEKRSKPTREKTK
jgi:4-amino-4-deoxy-L-arabinose transferase-like glycosyltransferase